MRMYNFLWGWFDLCFQPWFWTRPSWRASISAWPQKLAVRLRLNLTSFCAPFLEGILFPIAGISSQHLSPWRLRFFYQESSVFEVPDRGGLGKTVDWSGEGWEGGTRTPGHARSGQQCLSTHLLPQAPLLVFFTCWADYISQKRLHWEQCLGQRCACHCSRMNLSLADPSVTVRVSQVRRPSHRLFKLYLMSPSWIVAFCHFLAILGKRVTAASLHLTFCGE